MYHIYALLSHRDAPFLLKLAGQIINALQHKKYRKKCAGGTAAQLGLKSIPFT